MPMKNKIIVRFVLLLLIAIIFVPITFSQDSSETTYENIEQRPQQVRNQSNVNRLRRSLGLTQQQVQKIRELNQASRPQMQAANRKLREANRDLDLAIYADVLNQDLIAEKLSNFQKAQTELSSLRFKAELDIRMILTTEQLVTFRAMREKANERRGNIQQRINEVQRRRQGQRPPNNKPINK